MQFKKLTMNLAVHKILEVINHNKFYLWFVSIYSFLDVYYGTMVVFFFHILYIVYTSLKYRKYYKIVMDYLKLNEPKLIDEYGLDVNVARILGYDRFSKKDYDKMLESEVKKEFLLCVFNNNELNLIGPFTVVIMFWYIFLGFFLDFFLKLASPS
jgi:hypothetical protein